MNSYMKVIINSLKQWVNDMLTVLDKKLTKRIDDVNDDMSVRIDGVAARQDDMVKSVNNTLPDENGNVQITVGGEQVQPDYEQNNPEAADYIKNRPFYIGESTITEIFDVAAYMAENNLEWEQYPIDDTYAVIQAQLPVTIPVVDGGTYTFIIDGVEYVETAQYVTQGGMSGFMFGEAPADINSLTFYAGIVPEMNMSMFMCKASALPTEFRIVGGSQEIKKLDREFLPIPEGGYGWEEKTESEIVIEEQNIEGFAVLNEEIGTYSIELQKDEGFGFFDLQVNKTYTVVIDGVQYETTVNGCNRNGATTYVLGDYDAFWEGASSLTNEMPFYLYENANGEFGMGTKLSGESHIISVMTPEVITVHKINEKYLPPEKPIVQSDWNINNSALESYIKNRPFYVEHVTDNTLYEDTFVYDGAIKFDAKVLEEGKVYSINIDGALYTCKCWKYKETAEEANGIQLTWVGFGDGSRLGYESLKEDVPFCCSQTTTGTLGTSFSGDFTEGEHYLKIAEYVLTQVHEMDDKYAPLLKRAKLLYPEQEITSTTGEEIISRYGTLILKQDTVYRATFNGKEYELPSWIDNVGRIVVGSPEKHEGGGSAQSDIPFVLAYEDGNTPTERLVRLVWDINAFASCGLMIEEKYSETHSETMLSSQTVDFGQDENTSLYTAPINTDIVLEEGVRYEVTWDGSVYETSCEVITMNDVPWYCIGNTGLLSNPATTDDNMPFVIFKCFFMGFGAVTQLDDVSHTVSINKISEVNKIDSKYLPDNIGGSAVKSVNGVEPDENGNINVLGWEEADSIKIKPNYETNEGILDILDTNSGAIWYKVSEKTPELYSWNNGYITIAYTDEETGTTQVGSMTISKEMLDECNNAMSDVNIMYSFEVIVVVRAEEYVISGFTLSQGIWISGEVVEALCPGTPIIHKIDSKYLPDGFGRGSAPDWSVNDETDPAYVKNRTHYAIPPHEISWGGDKENCEYVIEDPDDTRYKFCYVSDLQPSDEEVMEMSIKVCSSENGVDLGSYYLAPESFKDQIIFEENYCALTGNFVVTREDNVYVSFAGTFPKAGVYLHLKESNGANTWRGALVWEEEVKQLDAKFVPFVNADWNQNDEKHQGYIANRPFYEDNSVELVYDICDMVETWSEQNNGADTFQIGAQTTDVAIEAGQEYIVTLNENTYNVTCDAPEDMGGMLALGDVDAYMNGDMTNVSYLILYVQTNPSSVQVIVKGDVPTTFTVEKQNNELVQIDEKFIPDTIARVSDVSAPKTEFILASSTEGSTKQFKITIDDTGTLTVSEIV